LGIVITGNPVRAQGDSLTQSLLYGNAILMRQSVDQVETERSKLVVTDALHEWLDLVVGLHPVDRFLHQRVAVLDPQTDTIETHSLVQGNGVAMNGPRIDFY